MALKTGTVYIGSPLDKGEQEKNQSQKSLESKKLDELVHRAGLIIFEIAAHYPFTSVLKSRLIITPNRLTILKRGMFYTDEYPMPIENITDAMVYTHFYYASLIIETFGIPRPDPIKYLKIKDARLARRYILALIECKKAGIDLSGMNVEELRGKLRDIGMVRYGSESQKYHDDI